MLTFMKPVLILSLEKLSKQGQLARKHSGLGPVLSWTSFVTSRNEVPELPSPPPIRPGDMPKIGDQTKTKMGEAHLDGFNELGVGETEAVAAMKRSVELAREAAPSGCLVAGSIGAYGASWPGRRAIDPDSSCYVAVF